MESVNLPLKSPTRKNFMGVGCHFSSKQMVPRVPSVKNISEKGWVGPFLCEKQIVSEKGHVFQNLVPFPPPVPGVFSRGHSFPGAFQGLPWVNGHPDTSAEYLCIKEGIDYLTLTLISNSFYPLLLPLVQKIRTT